MLETTVGRPVVQEGTITLRTDPISLPRPLHDLGPIFRVGGFVLAFAGFIDLALFYLRPGFGDASWEFVTIAQTFDAMPLLMLGLVLLALGARAARLARLSRAVAMAFAIVSVTTTILLVLLAFDVPAALRALRVPEEASEAWSVVVDFGLWPTVGKALLVGTAYGVGAALLARIMWTGAKQVEPG